MSQNGKIAKNSVILYVQLIITTIIGFVTTGIVVRTLGANDFGIYSVVGSIVVVMNFLNTVLSSTTHRFVAFEMGREDGKHVNKVFNISLSIHILLIGLLLLFSEIVGVFYIENYLKVEAEKIPDALFVFRFSVLATAIRIFSIPYQGLIAAVEKFTASSMIAIIRSVFNLGLVFLLIYLSGNKLRIYAVLIFILSLIPATLYITYCTRKYFAFTKLKLYKDKKKYLEILGFSGWTMIGAAAYMGRSTGTPIIINIFFGTILNAAYGVADRVNKLLSMFTQSISRAASPQIIKSFSGGDQGRTTDLVIYISKYTFLLLLFPALPILLETPYLMELWLGEVPEYTVVFVRLFVVLALIKSLSSGLPPAIQATGKIKWFQIINSTILLLGLPIAYILFKVGYPPYTILIAYVFIELINILVGLILLKIIINFNVKQLLIKSYLKTFLVLISVLPMAYFHSFFKEESLTRLICTIIMSVSIYAAIVFFIGSEKKERTFLIKMLQKVKDKNFKMKK